MNKNDFDSQMKLIEMNKKDQESKLRREYAFANNPHKEGDVIKDHSGYGRIEKIQISQAFGQNYPECIYHCEELTVKLQPKKNPSTRIIWQSNINHDTKRAKENPGLD